MRKMWVWIMVTMLLALVNDWNGRCYGCLEEERIGLLEIKASFNPIGVSWGLRDWVDNKEFGSCCEWSGIKCENSTKRVIQLSLTHAYDWSRWNSWILNASLFLPFQELRSLDLSSTGLIGYFENEGFEILLSRLKKLEVLRLRGNRFNDSLLSSLKGPSSLKSLDLSYNSLSDSAAFFGFKVLSSTLKKLENLDLSGNNYNESIFSSLSVLSSLKSLHLSRNLLKGLNGFKVLPKRLGKLENLFLSSSQLNDNIFSILSGLSSLKHLDLSNNLLTGSDINGFEIMSSNLRKLEYLDLSSNQFNDSILSCLSGFSSLKSLNLSDNMLSGFTGIKGLRKLEVLYLERVDFKESILLQSLGALRSLKMLSLRYNNNSNGIMIGSGLYNLTNLERLFLDYNSLPITFLQNIRGLSALRVLTLTECDLNGTLPAQGLCELKNLEQLDLSNNNLGGLLPACFGNLSSLQLLDVSGNQFNGNIASGPLANLISLKFLSLSNNQFEVPLSFKSFMNHSSLKFFICDNNKLIPEPVFPNLIPTFQLIFFSLSNSTSKALNSEIPNFFYNQYDLRFLDLSHNNFSGMFPSWLLKNNTRLQQLKLRKNSFVGPLQLQNHPNPFMAVMDISDHNMYGQIPRNMCLVFPNLWILRMSNNGLKGGIPSCFGNLSSLSYLDLSDNHLSTAKLEQLTTIEFISLPNNNLGGQISPLVFNSSIVKNLCLGGNNFWGQISDFSSTRQLEALDLSNNQFSGLLPKWLGNKSKVEAIDLSKNHFEGPIPGEFCDLDYLEYLDLSENNLSGSIPSCFNPQYITHVHLSNNRLSGPLTDAFYNSSSLVTLDLSDNSFTGSIPNWIGNLTSLSVLLLKGNHFDGEFSARLCLLKDLSILDVSQNKLSGPLPSCLGNLTLKASLKKAFMSSTMYHGRSFVNEMYEETMGPPLVENVHDLDSRNPTINIEEAIEFTTKKMSYGYKGNILAFMSGFDLSSNRFSGEIPFEMGKLSEIRALNLSHNNLTGSIPATFSNLKLLESLDLSYNNLNSGIPLPFTEMTSLAVFSVAHNNLSGKTPDRRCQFGTFDESSYEGNPFLCGPPLQNSCSEEQSPSQSMPNDEQEDDGFIDMDVFYVSFGVCYTIVVLAIVAVLYINPLWRRRWFHFVEEFIDTCYVFVVINFHKLSNFKKS